MKTIYLLKVTVLKSVTLFAIFALFMLANAKAIAQCPTPPGDPAYYSTDSWTGYVYSGLDANNPPQNAFTTTVYRGYLSLAEQFNWDLVNGAPTGPNVCGTYSDSFSIRYRMRKNWTPGFYTVTIGGDDGVRLSLDGGATWAMSDWNYHSYQTTTATLYLSGSVDMVYESYDQGGQYHVSFAYTACPDPSTAPTAISGTNVICNGSATTLTATGGTLATGAVYQWGTGATVGSNVIAGQTSESITVSPTTTTTYWVRRQDAAPCSMNTTGVTQQVTVTPVSTAPTSISGTTTVCAGNSVTLTATGGTLAAGAIYEWGTGTAIGSNAIAGETAASITVTPSSTTTYWVRRVNAGNCGRTSGVTTTVTVTAVAGDQTSYGSNSWIGYVYTGMDAANPPATPWVTYRGYITQPEVFDYNLGTSALTAANVCGTLGSNFAIRFKMNKIWTAGYYTFTVGGDDGYRFSMDGGATWTLSNWTDHSYATSSTSQIYLSGSKDFVIEFYERAGDSRITFNYTACTDWSTAPTSITGTTAICNGSSTTLTAVGGYAGALATYQWGTGATVGNNIIAGQTSASITVSPTASTTYWVRRVDGTPCSMTTTGVTQLVTVATPSTAPTSITGTTSTCGSSTTLTATGGTLVAGGAYEWGTGTVGSNVIAGQTGVSITVTPSATTTYWVRRTSPSPCNTPTNAATVTVTVNPASTAPTSISGSPSLCSTYGVTLSADGGTAASGSTYQWGTGSVVGTNAIAGQTSQTMYVNPTATTTYWVRRYDASCNSYTTGVTVTVNKGSTGPWSISGASTICANTSTVLTAQGGTPGTGSVYQWGTGTVAGSNVISGQTGASITVTPSGTTTYWVRLVDQGACPPTTAVFYTLNTYVAPTAVTSITGPTILCPGQGGGNLTANGGSLGSNGQYQWGTGAVGSNVFATYNPVYINPTTTTTYWVRTYDPTCNTYTAAVTFTVTANTPSTDPTTITATNTTICNGASVTLTASGGTMGTGAVYNWGTGYTVGQNVIAGQTGASITVSPTSQTVYWVRRVDPAPCSTQTGGPTITINITTISTAPTSISGTSPLCAGAGGTTLTANGATLGSNGQYQWGTGSVVGTNAIAGQTGNTYFANPTATTTYWVRAYDSSCSTYSSGVTFTLAINAASTAPTGVTGTNAICEGMSTTLTATGGSLGAGGVYQWGTGTAPNNIIAGETGVSITVSPTTTTTYWVRRIDGAPCNTTTASATRTVTVTALPTAPTSITGAPSGSACAGTSYTLTAVGGSGATYQWGTGAAIGSNIIAGQTASTITVTPTATTTYWVRRYSGGACTNYSGAATTTITISAPAGTPSVFGANQWNVYGYSTGDITLATAVYAGYYTSTALDIDTQTGTNSWNNQQSVSSSAGWTGCPVPVDNFTFAYKRKGFPCGTYTLTLANWDDQIRVYVDGTLVFSCDTWSGGGTCNVGAITGSFNLSTTSEVEVRVRENTGGSNLKMTFTKTDVASTAPTAITGAGASCSGASVTLTASGGTMGTNGSFQWGTGSPGTNIIAGQTSASITVAPATTTVYWVRRRDALCGLTTAAVTATVTVSGGTNAGTLTSPSTIICRNSTPQNITLAGYTGAVVKWQYADDQAFTVNVHDIASTSDVLTGAQIGPVPSTRYFRAVVQNGSCPVANTLPVVITILPAITYNGTWSGTPTALTPVVISANLTMNSSITACSCQVTNSATVTIQPNVTFTVQREVVVDAGATFVIENTGSLVQVEDDASNIGTAIVKRWTSPMKGFDFTYWSSPVQNWTLYNLSPETRFDKYYSFDPITNNWIVIMNGAGVMQPGRGYILRAPANWSLTNATQGVYHGSFTGIPNSGVVAAPFQKGAGSFNLIGNPYPSAIDIDLFLTDPANANIVNGTIYLWTHNSAISSSIPGNSQYNYTADDYAKYNLTGGVKTANPAITGTIEPTGKVASGQSFFIDSATGLANGSYTATFRNSMRVAGNNDQFFRPASTHASETVAATQTVSGLEKHRAWINIHNSVGAYDEMLVGYIQNATNSMDRLFDGPVFNGGNNVSLYSILGNNKLSIQGRALPFEATDVIPVGYKVSTAGTFTISLEHFDGLFANQSVYLLDKTDMSYHNLSEAEYSFTSAIGVFDTRFEIHFQTGALGTNTPTVTENTVYIVKNDKHIEVSSGNFNMAEIQIFDLTGKKVYEKQDINATLFSTKDLNIAAQVLIVKVTLDNDVTITKKVIMY